MRLTGTRAEVGGAGEGRRDGLGRGGVGREGAGRLEDGRVLAGGAEGAAVQDLDLSRAKHGACEDVVREERGQERPLAAEARRGGVALDWHWAAAAPARQLTASHPLAPLHSAPKAR